ncbi:MAG: hypothetical protein GIX02_07745 [Candidatus Eremiobacteraeota bacterium]|nr:hypothetical protein [Candidatus Eremiobacteraeota bacterium]
MGAGRLVPDGLPVPDHITIVVMENKTYGQIIGSTAAPYENALAQSNALMTDSHGVEHPSEPNYLDLFSGANQGVTDDSCPHTFSATSLGGELIAAGLSFKWYAEQIPAAGSAVCASANLLYRRKHVASINFSDTPAADTTTYDQLSSDIANGTYPTVAIVSPDMCDDMHDCSVATGDQWLANHLPPIIHYDATHNGLLILTFDESENSKLDPANHITTTLVGPMVVAGQYAQTISHFNVLRTIEEMYGLSYLGASSGAGPLTGMWIAPSPTPSASPVSSPSGSATPSPSPTPSASASPSPSPPTVYLPGTPNAPTTLFYMAGKESGAVSKEMDTAVVGNLTNETISYAPGFTGTWGWITGTGAPNLTAWPAATYTVTLNITQANAALEILGVKIYRVDSSGGPNLQGLALVGQLSGLSQFLSNAGPLTFVIHGAAQNAASTARLAVKFREINTGSSVGSFSYDSGAGAVSQLTVGP